MDSTVEEILKTVDRFRILCVGRSGVGKSSVINRVFGLDIASVAHWEAGKADINNELTSVDNRYLVLHDSMGFEPADTTAFDIVNKFIQQRLDKSLPLKDRLHAVWLCTETPRAGGRVFETGEERLLQLASEAQIPIVVVFTKYDGLVWTKKRELEEENLNLSPEDLDERGEKEAKKVLDACIQSVENTYSRLKLKDQTIRLANVSIRPGYEARISYLIEVTRVVVQEKIKGDAWVAWVVTQRANLPLNIDLCIKQGIVHYRRFLDGVGYWDKSLYDVLAEIHQNIITIWNFKHEGILGNDEFKQLMRYLVEDVQESQNDGTSQDTSSRAMEKIFRSLSSSRTSNTVPPPDATTQGLTDWLKTSLHNTPKVRRLLVTYIIDLTTVLKSLFDVLTPTRMPESSVGITWSELKEAFEAYKNSRQRIHGRISEIFQEDQQISNIDSFGHIFRELVPVDDAEVSAPVAAPVATPVATSSTAQVPGSNLAPVAAPNTAQEATPSPALEQRRPRRKWCPRLCG